MKDTDKDGDGDDFGDFDEATEEKDTDDFGDFDEPAEAPPAPS